MEERWEVENTLDSIWEDEFALLKISALLDGNEIEPYETVMHIEGPAASFAHLSAQGGDDAVCPPGGECPISRKGP